MEETYLESTFEMTEWTKEWNRIILGHCKVFNFFKAEKRFEPIVLFSDQSVEK